MSKRPQRFNPYKMFIGSFIPEWLEERPEISGNAKLLYARLCRYAGENGYCVPSQGQLSQALGLKERNIRYLLDELIAQKLLEKERTGVRKTNHYYFLIHRWMKDAMALPPRAGEPIPNRQNSAGLIPNRQDSAGPNRQDSAGPNRQNLVIDDASTPSGTKASGRLRESVEENHLKRIISPPLPPPPPRGLPEEEEVEALARALGHTSNDHDASTEGVLTLRGPVLVAQASTAQGACYDSQIRATAGQAAPRGRSSRAKAPQTLCPVDYAPSPELVESLQQHYPGSNVLLLVDRMRHWAESHGERRASWDGELRTFALNDWVKRGSPAPAPGPQERIWRDGDMLPDGTIYSPH